MDTNKDKTALITGASRGIGKAIAYALAEKGYNLHLTCRSNERMLNAIADNLTSTFGITCKCYTGDVSDPAFADEVFENINSLDVLINNAGISYFGLITDMSINEWREVMGCNLDSVFYFSRKASSIMISQHSGHIINISSVWGEHGSCMETAYSASKGGVNSLTKALARELAPSGISVNAVACGLIDTDMNSHLSQSDIQDIIDDIPADRIGKPAEIGQMIVSILCAPSYMTGQIITVDGGWT